MKTLITGSEMTRVMPARVGGITEWQRWVPYAAVFWSLLYAALGFYWAISGNGFPYPAETASDMLRPLLGRLGSVAAWTVVMTAGIPAAVFGIAMLRGVKTLRSLLITAGTLLAATLLLLMTSLTLLIKLGYFPYALLSIFKGAEFGQIYLQSLAEWAILHQFLCMIGGFLWLGATVCYSRRSVDACAYCGRRDNPETWTSSVRAERWGRIAVYVAMVAPLFYTFTRYAWALGFQLGMSDEQFRRGQEGGEWIMGALFLGTFNLVGAALMLGLIQRWGEVFPRWMIGLAGRRVPIALAVTPAALASILLIVGGITIWFDLPRMITMLTDIGAQNTEIIGAVIFQLGPTLLFPVWGIALAIAALGYYFRRRGLCTMCGRGA